MKAIMALLLISVLLVAGCVSPAGDTGGEVTGESETLTDVGNDISGLDSLASDLDMSDLENLDTELEDLNW